MSDLSVSLILLAYNQSETIAEAVQSALGQEGDPIEIVITDDCSTDDTFAVIEQTVRGYGGPHNVIVNRNATNLGLAGNVEKAHRLSSGEVIVAAAGDDISLPSRTRRIRNAFAAHAPMLVCSYAHVIDPQGQPIAGDFRTASFYRPFDLARAARSKSLYIGATGAWHRDLYDRYGPLDPDAYEDLVLGFRAALEQGVHVIKEELVKYRLGQGLTSSDFHFTDIAAFRARRRKGFIANRAIMRQRIRDVETSGVDVGPDILAILRKEVLRAELGLAFHDETPGGFLARALRHPLLGLFTWHSERRRIRKTEKRIRSRKPHG